LQAGAVSLFNDCSDRGVNEQTGVQRGYAVIDLELLLIIWLLRAGTGRNLPLTKHLFQAGQI
jgi:hypothetical protein